VRIDRIGIDDIVEVRIKGRTILGRVTEIKDGTAYFEPICRGAGWRHATAREVVAHWRKAGRPSGRDAEEQIDATTPMDGQ
jgi:translation initiation factor 2 gamma subunit (eIF-2gamma)